MLFFIRLNNKLISVIALLYLLIGMMYYYIGDRIPFEFTWDWLRDVVVFSFLLSPLLVGMIIGHSIPDKYQKNPFLGTIIILLILVMVGHHLIWTLLVLWQRGGYEDRNVSYPDESNRKHKIITQYKDEGAIGDHSRIMEVYEFSPFLRYVYRVEYLDYGE
jgi:hypothetical protein